MNPIEINLTLGFLNNEGIFTIPVKQLDTGRYIRLSLLDADNNQYIISSDVIPFIRELKPDGKQIENYDCCTIEGNDIIIRLTQQMLSLSGIAKCDISLISKNKDIIITTKSFNLLIDSLVHDSSQIVNDSSSECDILARLVIDSQTALSDILKLSEEINKSEVIRTEKDIMRETIYNKTQTLYDSAKDGLSNIAFTCDNTPNDGLNNYKIKVIGMDGEVLESPNLYNNLSIGKVETIDPNSDASASIVGEFGNSLLNLKIPKGEKGNIDNITPEDILFKDNSYTATNVKDALLEIMQKLKDKYDELFTYASSGKSKIAAAITGKKIPTSVTDTFDVMAGNIDKIKLGSGNATADKVLQGTTFTGDSGVEQTGTMVNQPSGKEIPDIASDVANGRLNAYIDVGAYVSRDPSHTNKQQIRIPFANLANALGITTDRIKYGLNLCGIAGSFTGDGTITPDKVLTGDKGYSKGQIVNGSIPLNNATTPTTEIYASQQNKELRVKFPYGYYPKELYNGTYYDPYVKANFTDAASALNITPDKIVSGQTVCGVAGTGKSITQIAANVSAPTVNIASLYANYKNLTADNFFIRVTRLNTTASINNATHISCNGGTDISIIYNSNTGIMTMNRSTSAIQNGGELRSEANITYDLFIIY